MRGKISRRNFIEGTAKMAAGLTIGNSAPLLFAAGNKFSGKNIFATIPMPIQVVIDDVGWWSGEDGSKRQEPYRTGIKRQHVPADYQAIADLGKKLNIRPQAATILCEWDRENILRNLPTSTWMREKWDNSKWVGPWLDEAADIIRNNKNHYELTLHGVGHEYWNDTNFTRAEWADRTGFMRPLDQVELHLDYFSKLMDQNRLGPFPESFVPAAFLHGFGPTADHKISMAEVLIKRGISYINTPFYNMYNAKSVQHGLFGIDAGVITVDRGEDLFDWNIIAGKPDGVLSGPSCGLHWPNLLHENPERNSEIVEEWVKFLAPYNAKPETVLASDSLAFRKQLIHHVLTKIQANESALDLDFRRANKLPEIQDSNEIIIKVASRKKLVFKPIKIQITASNISHDKDLSLYTLVLKRLKGNDTARVKFEKA